MGEAISSHTLYASAGWGLLRSASQ